MWHTFSLREAICIFCLKISSFVWGSQDNSLNLISYSFWERYHFSRSVSHSSTSFIGGYYGKHRMCEILRTLTSFWRASALRSDGVSDDSDKAVVCPKSSDHVGSLRTGEIWMLDSSCFRGAAKWGFDSFLTMASLLSMENYCRGNWSLNDLWGLWDSSLTVKNRFLLYICMDAGVRTTPTKKLIERYRLV